MKIKILFSGFDIGNHFCEFMFDYKSAEDWPLFKADFNSYPNENQQVNNDKYLIIFNHQLFFFR
jgi:thiamine kinase-like enzyme